MRALLAAGGGFLAAVLWMDLMFDVQVRGHPTPAALPEAVLASIATYYRRVTTDAHPMSRLIALVMVATVGGALWLAWHERRRWSSWLAVLLCTGPIALAGTRVLPNAIRLGARADSSDVQSSLARAIFRDHIACFVAIGVFVVLQVVAARQRPWFDSGREV